MIFLSQRVGYFRSAAGVAFARPAAVHAELPAFDEILQRCVLADEFPGLHVFFAEAGEEDLGVAASVAIIVDVEVAVRGLGDVGVGDAGAFVEQQPADQGLPSSVERKAVSSWRPAVAFVMSWP